MVKVTSSILVGAALFASSSTLAAPTRFKRASNADVSASTDLLDGNGDESELIDEVASALGVDQQAVTQMIADNLAKRDNVRTGSDAIRRGLPLAPNSSEQLAKRESVVAKLGLTGALAPLGVGSLVPTVQGLVDGLPVVGGPVGGLVKTVDTTVGVTDLLNKPKAKRQFLDGLLGATTAASGLTSGLPLGSTLNTGTSTINGLLGQLQGAGGSNSQLAGVLGQLQGLGLGNLPLSALTGSSTSALTGSTTSTASGAVTSTVSSQSAQQAASILQGLTIAQAEQYGLLPSGTTGRLLNQIETAAEAQASSNNLASSFTSRPHGFKDVGSNETMTEEEGEEPRMSTEEEGGATPTFAIASPEAVASAINLGGAEPMNSTSTTTSAAEMSKRTSMPSMVSSGPASSMTPSSTASASKPSSTSMTDSMEDSGSEYSDDDEDFDEDDADLDDTPSTPGSEPALARRGGDFEDSAEPDEEMSKKHHGGMEGQGPNAEGAWHATESTSMAQTSSQAVATSKAMEMTYSDASATAVPTTAPSKRGYAELD